MEILLYYMREKKTDNISVGIESDRSQNKLVYNEWLDQEIAYLKNGLEDGRTEYETLLTIDENIYYFSGIMPEEEFVKIIKNFLLNRHKFLFLTFILIEGGITNEKSKTRIVSNSGGNNAAFS